MANGKKELGNQPVGGRAYSEVEKGLSALEGGRNLSDVDQAFIARIERAFKSGKIISDVDQKRYKRLTGKNWPGGGRTTSDRDLPGGRTVSDRLKKHGGSVKKYAKGGGVRKARYK